MKESEFCYWFQGFFELSQSNELITKQVQITRDHLQLVFNKATPDRNEIAPGIVKSDISAPSRIIKRDGPDVGPLKEYKRHLKCSNKKESDPKSDLICSNTKDVKECKKIWEKWQKDNSDPLMFMPEDIHEAYIFWWEKEGKAEFNEIMDEAYKEMEDNRLKTGNVMLCPSNSRKYC